MVFSLGMKTSLDPSFLFNAPKLIPPCRFEGRDVRVYGLYSVNMISPIRCLEFDGHLSKNFSVSTRMPEFSISERMGIIVLSIQLSFDVVRNVHPFVIVFNTSIHFIIGIDLPNSSRNPKRV